MNKQRPCIFYLMFCLVIWGVFPTPPTPICEKSPSLYEWSLFFNGLILQGQEVGGWRRESDVRLAAHIAWPGSLWTGSCGWFSQVPGNYRPRLKPLSVNITASDRPLQFRITLCRSHGAPRSLCKLSRHSWPWLSSKQFMLGTNQEIS